MGVSIDILGCSHGNERLGLVLDEQLRSDPIPGVRSRIAHAEAVKKGVRHIGSGQQLQQHYPGRRFGDPEDRAAYRNMRWLGSHAGSTETFVYDVHNTDVPNLTAFSVGRRALKATMVGAWLLGYDKCYLIDDPFRRAVPNAALLENGVAEADYEAVAKRLHTNLGNLAFMGASELQERYDEVATNVRFYTKHEILTTSADGAVKPFIPSLETVASGNAFTPLDLSAEQRGMLGIPDEVDEVLTESWGHLNMSMVLPDAGETADGLPRRFAFGAYFLPAQPPVANGNWAISGALGSE